MSSMLREEMYISLSLCHYAKFRMQPSLLITPINNYQVHSSSPTATQSKKKSATKVTWINVLDVIIICDHKTPDTPDTEDRRPTWRDVKLIMPTLLILLFTVLVILTVIPYAFSSVIKQLNMVQSMEEAGSYQKFIKLLNLISFFLSRVKKNESNCLSNEERCLSFIPEIINFSF